MNPRIPTHRCAGISVPSHHRKALTAGCDILPRCFLLPRPSPLFSNLHFELEVPYFEISPVGKLKGCCQRHFRQGRPDARR